MPRRIRTKATPKKKVKGGANKKAAKLDEYLDPEVLYVTAMPPISVEEVAKRTGFSVDTLRHRAMNHKWTAKREDYHARLREEAYEALKDTTKSKIVEANKRHISIGQAGQGIGVKLFRRADEMLEDPAQEVKITDAVRTGSRAIKDGVDVERKGLGLADQVMFVQNMRELMTIVIVVAQQELGGHPDLLENFVNGIQTKFSEAEQKAGKLIEANYQARDDED